MPQKIIIIGETLSGEKFRPGDWAERMTGSLCTFRNRRMIYSPLLKPAICDGKKCVIVDESLKESHPSLFEQVINFAENNQLKTETHQSDEEANSE